MVFKRFFRSFSVGFWSFAVGFLSLCGGGCAAGFAVLALVDGEAAILVAKALDCDLDIAFTD